MNTDVDGHSLHVRYSTIWPGTNPGEKKIHVDVPGWYGLAGEVRITVAVGAQVGTSTICVAQKDFSVQLPTHKKKAAVDSHPAKQAASPAEKKEAVKTEKKELGVSLWGKVEGKKKESVDKGRALFASLHKLMAREKSCKSWPEASWILLTIVSIAVALVVIDSIPYLLLGGGVRFGAALLVMFLIMIGTWFLHDRCREHRWFPIAVTVITLFALTAPTNFGGKKKTKRS